MLPVFNVYCCPNRLIDFLNLFNSFFLVNVQLKSQGISEFFLIHVQLYSVGKSEFFSIKFMALISGNI